MSIALVNATTATGASVSSLAASVLIANNNRMLVMHCSMRHDSASQQVSSITDSTGLVWQLYARQSFTTSTGHFITQEVWWVHAFASAPTHTATANFTAAVVEAGMTLYVISGVTNVTDPWDHNVALPATASNTSGTASAPAVSVDSTTSDSQVIGFITTAPDTTPTAISGFAVNSTFDYGSERGSWVSRAITAPATALTVGVNETFGDWGIIGAVLTSQQRTGGLDIETGGQAIGSTTSTGVGVGCDTRGDDRVLVVVVVTRGASGGNYATVLTDPATSADGLIYTKKAEATHTRAGETTRIEVFWSYQAANTYNHHGVGITFGGPAGSTAEVVGACMFSVSGCYDITAPWDSLALASNSGTTSQLPNVTFDIAATNSLLFFVEAADEDGVNQDPAAGWSQQAQLLYRDTAGRQNRSSVNYKNLYPGPNSGITQQGAEVHTDWAALVVALTDQANPKTPITAAFAMGAAQGATVAHFIPPIEAIFAMGFDEAVTVTHTMVQVEAAFDMGMNQFSPITHIDPEGPGGEDLPVFQSMVITVAN